MGMAMEAAPRFSILRSMVAAIWIEVLCMAGAPARPADAAASQIEVYGHLPSLEDLALSPDGTRVVFVGTREDERNLYVKPLNENKVLGAAHVGDVKLRAIEWMDNDNILLEVSSTSLPPLGFMGPQQEWFQLGTFNVPKKRFAGVSFDVNGERTFNVISGSPMLRVVGGATTLFVPGIYVTDRTLPALFRYDVADRYMRLIAKSGYPRTEWLIDENGATAGEFIYRDEQKQWEFRLGESGRMRSAASGIAPIDVPDILGFSASGDSILFRFVENGETLWRPLSLKDGSWGAPLAHGQAFTRPIVDRKSGRIIGGVQGIDDSRYVFFDNELQAHWDAVLRAFPNERVELLSHSDDYARLLVRVFGAKDGYVYALFDWYGHRAMVVGKVYEGLETVAEVKHLTYQAADGLEIPAYLTLPRGRSEANLPLVVLPHGGPAAADSDHFDWWAQALANEGYAVLQPNYRGSTVSERFMAAGYGEWGRKMQTDLSDGVRYLARQGTIDPKRVCIVGASYGGYAALAGITLDPGVYRCAVSVAGLSDLRRILRWTNENSGHRDNHGQRYWDRFMGVSGPDDPALKAISPIEHMAAVTAPVLLIHGRDDTVVPYEQSQVMADALKHAGKSVEFVTLKREDHWLSHSATRFQMLQATVAFLKANNPPN
jgi:dipeptidyl aminopeptidase/acylaminoacyl peptidase